jgi:uncharacterized protein YecA (UPF0149 family)
MDTNTGKIQSFENWDKEAVEKARKIFEKMNFSEKSTNPLEEQIKKCASEMRQTLKPVDIKNLSQKSQRELNSQGVTYIKPGTRCPCGSGKLFRRCCKT